MNDPLAAAMPTAGNTITPADAGPPDSYRPSARAQIITRRSYNRPLDEAGTRFESWEQTVDRVISHQRWLWERALRGRLRFQHEAELAAFGSLVRARRCLPAGRVLWLGGTEMVRRRESSGFNCAFNEIQAVHDVVDIFWLLLQGCGTGFKPVDGVLSGFSRRMAVEVVRSTRTERGGREDNVETFDPEAGTWTIEIGDSAEAWAKAAGKLVVGKFPAKKLVVDLSQVRPPGERLRGYGWLCSGDEMLARALGAIAAIRNKRVGKLLTKIDILDVVNWLGTVLSTRRSAQACLMDHGDPECDAFAVAKPPGFWEANPQRAQSNNGIMFWEKPTTREIRRLFDLMVAHGGGEPSFNNAAEAKRRAPWFSGFNPCVPADTWIHTADGARRVSALINTPFVALVDGKPYRSKGFVQTGVRPVFRLRLSTGVSVRATANHRILVVTHQSSKVQRTEWRELGSITPGDRVILHNHRGVFWTGNGERDEGYLLGSLIGDGTLNAKTAYLDFWGEDRRVMADAAVAMVHATVGARSDCRGSEQTARVGKRRVQSTNLRRLAESYGINRERNFGDAVEESSWDFYSGFLRGWFDTDGTVGGSQEKGVSVRLLSVKLDKLERAQRMLLRMGISSTIYRERLPEGYRDLPDGRGGLAPYWCQAAHELAIANDNIGVFAEAIGFSEPAKVAKLARLLAAYRRRPNRERFAEEVVAVEPDGTEPVYDCAVPGPDAFDADGVYVHNCYEILLANRGFCVAGDTPLITRNGLHEIRNVAGANVEVWNGASWSVVTPRVTGTDQAMVRVYLGDGSYLDCTPYHRFSVRDRFMGEYAEVEAKDLMTFSRYAIHAERTRVAYEDGDDYEDAYTLGVMVGDGSVAQGVRELDLYGDKMQLPVAGKKTAEVVKPGYGVASVAVRELRHHVDMQTVASLKTDVAAINPLFSWSRKSILEFVAGWLDTDGSETGTGGVRLYLAGYDRALRVQLLLTKCGIASSVNLHQKAGTATNYGVRKTDSYYVQITDCDAIPCHRLDTSQGHVPRRKGRYQTIRAVVPLPGRHTVYCFNEPERHKAVFANVLTFQCNLSEVNLARFRDDHRGLHDATWLVARANYRQTLVDLRDGILQTAWHENNEFLRLCGVGLTGIAQRPDMTPYDFRQLRNTAIAGAYSMADELGLERPKNVTTIKPSGTISKVVDATEGAHKPLGRYIFNNVAFGRHDPLVGKLADANYHIFDHPTDPSAVLATLPVAWDHVPFECRNETPVNLESAVSQLERYRALQANWSDQNTSITVSYDPSEVKDMVKWFDRHWDSYVGVSFLFRNDPTKTAADLGFAYLPQEVVTRAAFDTYAAGLKPIDLDDSGTLDTVLEDDCAGGACPIR